MAEDENTANHGEILQEGDPILCLEEANVADGKAGERPSTEVVESNVAVKQTDESGGNVAINVGNKNNNQKRENQNAEGRKPDYKKCPWYPKHENYIPHNDTGYLVTQSTENYKKSSHRESTKRETSKKYYRFHEIHGHNTNECQHLRDVIEDLIRKKKLQQYVKDPRNGRQINNGPQGQIA